jgi:uncharacterized membrane-anchored protein
MKKTCVLSLCLLMTAAVGAADNAPSDPMVRLAEQRKMVEELRPQSGNIALKGGIATIALSPAFKYLDPKDSDTVLTRIWRNPKGGASLGMIVPTGFDPMSPGGWVVVITYSEDGYVKDNDASTLDYNKLLAQMKEGTSDMSKQREKQGYPPIELIGWAEPPRYDASTHKMYWAKALKFGNSEEQTLNYNIRILGRRGVLVLNAVAPMDELPQVREATPSILGMVNFQDGNRYSDFNPSTDKIATYGIAALVLGGIAVKAGLFKVILVGLLAAKKFVLLAFLAVAGYFKKLKGRFSKKPDGLVVPSDGKS